MSQKLKVSWCEVVLTLVTVSLFLVSGAAKRISGHLLLDPKSFRKALRRRNWANMILPRKSKW